MVKVALLLLGAFLLGSWLASCLPNDARADSDPALRLTVSTVRTGAGTFRVRLYWRYQPGTFDSVRISVGVDPNWSSQYQTKASPYAATYVRDSFNLTSVAGVPMTGQASVRTKKRGTDGVWRESAVVIKPWAYTEPAPVDTMPPAPPLFDSVRVSALEVVPGSWSMMAGTGKQFCAVLVFATGQKAIVGGQRGIAACEAVEAALPLLQRPTTAQYEVAGTWLSCVNTATGKTCRKADGSTVLVQRPGPAIRLARGS